MTDETKRVQISIHLDEALLHQLEAAAKQEIRSVSGEAAYYDNGGDRHVAACLAARDISQSILRRRHLKRRLSGISWMLTGHPRTASWPTCSMN